jgi:hypothetical protein
VPSAATSLADEVTDRQVDKIEMIGEELAAGMPVPTHQPGITPAMRYLHCSRTIHQLVTDRNRAVAIFLAVASLLWTASTALLNARPNAHLIVPLESLQRWCVPVTLATCAVLAIFTSFLLIRTRVGLIYEVAKMNVMLGLPVGRVSRIAPLSIFFIMHSMIALAGGGSMMLFVYHLFALAEPAGVAPGTSAFVWSLLIGLLSACGLKALYIGAVLHITSDKKLQNLK